LLRRALEKEPFWLAEFEGQPVAMGRLTRTEGSGFAGLYGGASHPDYRRRGFYRPVVHARVQAAAEMGCQWVFSEALPTSEPILRVLGFETLCQVTGYLYRFDD
jgi:N-acetylglutamate synthase-like GNAT family acetyltransferase